MFYMLHRCAGAEDDGSAWEFETIGAQAVRRQVRPLTVGLLQDGLRAFAVGGEILVDKQLAEEIERIDPSVGRTSRRANVIGPQPELAPRPPMMQLLGEGVAYLARESIVEAADGTKSFKQPFVLDSSRPMTTSIGKIMDNGVVIVSKEVREVLMTYAPNLSFRFVRYENEPAPADEPETQKRRIPTAEELKGKYGG
jgi:hypothetical protein